MRCVFLCMVSHFKNYFVSMGRFARGGDVGVVSLREVWRRGVSGIVSILMVLTSLPLSVLVPQVAMSRFQ